MTHPFSPALVIAGMHRSGTSLAASLVATAGLHLGDRLMGAERGNVKGHFEDLDFYEFHQRALLAAGLGREGFTCATSIPLLPAVHDELDALIAQKRSAGRPWGWKDPRTTLFLDAWSEKLPEARFLLIFRRPWEVVDSLFRRGDTAFLANPRLAAEVWLAYNRRVREFFVARRDRCLLVETTRVARDPVGMVAAVSRLLGIELGQPESRYDPELLVEDGAFDRLRLVRGMHPEAIDLYHALCELADKGPAAADGGASPTHVDDLVDAAAMQWVRAARMEQIGRSREAELVATFRRLTAVQAERDELARRLDFAAAETLALQTQRDVAAREAALLAEQLSRPRPRKTVRERLSLEGRRLVRQASGLVGLTILSPTSPGR